MHKNTFPEGRVSYTYTKNVSKNKYGGVNQLQGPNKVVHQFQNDNLSDRCDTRLLDLYLSKVPVSAKQLDMFYLQPMVKLPKSPTAPWYACVSLGKNMLSQMIKKVCQSRNGWSQD